MEYVGGYAASVYEYLAALCGGNVEDVAPMKPPLPKLDRTTRLVCEHCEVSWTYWNAELHCYLCGALGRKGHISTGMRNEVVIDDSQPREILDLLADRGEQIESQEVA